LSLKKVPNSKTLHDLLKSYKDNSSSELAKDIVKHIEFTLMRTRFSIDEAICF